MTNGSDEPKAPGRRGRPSDTAEPSTEASERAAAAIRAEGRTQKWVADQLGVSERTVRRWLDGRPENRGPTRETAERLARLLKTPELVELWWPPREPPAAPPAPPAVPADDGARSRRHRLRIAAGATAVLVLLGVLIGSAVSRGNPDPPVDPASEPVTPGPAAPAAGCGSPTAGAPAAARTVTGKVCGDYAGNRAPARSIGLWTKPGMSTGCDLDACPPETKQAGRVTVGRNISVSCVVADGQMLRNGSAGEPGYYEDRRWVRLAPGQ